MLKTKNHNKEDVLSECIIMADVGEMSREDLEQFADRMRIDRNSFLIEKETIEDKVLELETELYFCNRNKRVGEMVDGN